MADTEQENVLGFVDRRRTQNQTQNPGSLDVDARYLSVGDLRSLLTTFNAPYFTTARLDNMTKNDLVYAVRLAGDSAGI